MNGKPVLIALSSSGTPDEAISFAVERARKDNTGVVALYLLDTDLSKEASDAFTDSGFIGDKPSSELSESLMREYRQRGYEELGRVQVKAMEAGVAFEPLMEEGEFVANILDNIIKYNIQCAVIIGRRKNVILKYFSRSLADEVKSKAGCEVVVFEENA
ncbi:universal stress protein [bacterium]|nr:MAG: universal stress protein [bacterium]